MLFIDVEDFLTQVQGVSRPDRELERDLAQRMVAGDEDARAALVRGYLPFVAGYVRRAPAEIRTLHTVYACIASLEQGVGTFNFLQEGETFAHHLSWRMRQCLTRCIADRP